MSSPVVSFAEPHETRRVVESLRASVAGEAAVKAATAALAIFRRGGHRALGEGGRAVVRDAAERMAKAAAIPALAAAEAAPALAAKGVAIASARVALREIARGTGRAAGIGFVLDAGLATVTAVRSVRAGTMDTKAAARHVALEGATGAVATGAGVLLGAGLVALTGGIAAPVVFAVGALGSTGVKRVLTARTQTWFAR